MADIKIFLTSWNCAGNKLKSNVDLVQDWFKRIRGEQKEFDPDIIVIGQQEAKDSAHTLLSQAGIAGYWPLNHSSLSGFAGGAFVKQYLSVLVKSSLFAWDEGNVPVTKGKAMRTHLGSGINVLGQNKGGCVSFVDINDARLAFVTCHLESKDKTNTVRSGQLQRLLNDVRQLSRQTKVKRYLNRAWGQGGKEPNAIFLMGDLNYRLTQPEEKLTAQTYAEMMVFDREPLYQWDTFNRDKPFNAIEGDGRWVFPDPRSPGGTLWPVTYKLNPKCPSGEEFTNMEIPFGKPHGYMSWRRELTGYLREGLPKSTQWAISKAYSTYVKFKDKDPGGASDFKGKRAGELDAGWLDRIGYTLSIKAPLFGIRDVKFLPCNMTSAKFMKSSDHMAVCMMATLEIRTVAEGFEKGIFDIDDPFYADF